MDLRFYRLIALLLLFCVPLGARAADGLVTVMDYGAVGNGTTDDTTAFEQALAASRFVMVPEGRFRVTRRLNLVANTVLVGPGTIYVDWDLNAPNSTNAVFFLAGNDVTIDGLVIEKKFIDGSYQTGIIADRRTGITIRNTEIRNFSARYGIHIIESTRFEISGCYVHSFMMNSTADMIEDSPAGIRITRSLRGVISGNILKNIEVGPFGLTSISPLRPAYGPQGYQSDHITMMQCRDVAVIGNTLLTSGEGIDILLSESCTLNGNVIRNIWFEGYKLLGSAFNTVADNHISDCYIGIGLDDGASNTKCYGNSINGNMIRNTGAPGTFGSPGPGRVNYGQCYAIWLGGISNHNIITENVIMDTQTTKTMVGGVRSNGASNNRIADNLVNGGFTYESLPPY